MFGLTKREQYWNAQERGMKMILDSANKINELEYERIKNENLKLEIELQKLKLINQSK